MASKVQGHPQRVIKGYPLMVDWHYDSGTTARRYVSALSKGELMRVAGAIGKDRGHKHVATLQRTRDELVDYIREQAPWDKKDSIPMPKPTPIGDRIPTDVTHSCGHTYRNRIRREQYDRTKKWLESKPCPRCASGDAPKPSPVPDTDQDQGTPEPTPKPSPKPDATGLDLDALADVLVSKVMERMRPVTLPDSHHKVLPDVIKIAQAGCNAWLQGPPGTAKTTIAEQVADALGLPFYKMPFHPSMNGWDIFGFIGPNGNRVTTAVEAAWRDGGVLLLDECDNGNPATTACLNGLTDSSKFATFAGEKIARHKDCIIMAAANTSGNGPEAGFLGREGVDAATLTRFCKVFVDIDTDLETTLVTTLNPTDGERIVAAISKIRREVEARGLDVFVGPRDSLDVAKLMRAGFTMTQALRMKSLAGVDQVTFDSLTEAL